MIYRHKQTGQVVRPVPGSKEQRRLADSGRYTEVKAKPKAKPEAAPADPPGELPAERRDASVTGTAKIQTGGKARE